MPMYTCGRNDENHKGPRRQPPKIGESTHDTLGPWALGPMASPGPSEPGSNGPWAQTGHGPIRTQGQDRLWAQMIPGSKQSPEPKRAPGPNDETWAQMG